MQKGIKADIRHHKRGSMLIDHMDEGCLPQWNDTKILKNSLLKQHKKANESYITRDKNISAREQVIMCGQRQQYKISIQKGVQTSKHSPCHHNKLSDHYKI